LGFPPNYLIRRPPLRSSNLSCFPLPLFSLEVCFSFFLFFSKPQSLFHPCFFSCLQFCYSGILFTFLFFLWWRIPLLSNFFFFHPPLAPFFCPPPNLFEFLFSSFSSFPPHEQGELLNFPPHFFMRGFFLRTADSFFFLALISPFCLGGVCPLDHEPHCMFVFFFFPLR